jgi:hypothetical protein
MESQPAIYRESARYLWKVSLLFIESQPAIYGKSACYILIVSLLYIESQPEPVVLGD